MIIKYIKRLILKEWLPVIAIFGLVSLALFITHCLNVNIYKSFSNAKRIFDFVYLSIPMTIFAFVLPMFVYSYRFKIQACDTYYQLPFEPKKLKNIRVLTGLLTILSVYTAVFVIGFLFFTVLYYYSPLVTVSGIRVEFYPFMLFVTYIIGLFTISGVYFQSCFFASLTNSILSAVILNLSIQIFLSLFSFSLSQGYSKYLEEFIFLSPSIVGANGMVQTFAYSFVLDPSLYQFNHYHFEQLLPSVPYILSVFNALIFAACTVFVILEKDPSGENAGQPATRNKIVNYIIYTSVIVELILIRTLFSSVSLFPISVVLGAIYFGYRYLVSALFFHSAKLSIEHYVIIGVSSLLFMVL